MNRRQKQTLIVIGIAALIGWAQWDGRPDLTPEPATTTTSSTATTAAPAPTQTPTSPATAPASADPLYGLTRDVIAAWQAPTTDQRQAALAPLVTTAYLEQAATIDSTDVPTATIRDITVHRADDIAVADVTLTDDTAITVDITTTDGRPYVENIRPS